METAVSFLKVGLRLAGNLCGVPGVSVLADAVVTLIETCENIPKQRQSVRDLQKRSVSLLQFLDAESSRKPTTSERLEMTINQATEIISSVEKRMKRWEKKNKWKMFLYTGSIDDDVVSSTSDINRIVESLQLLFQSQVRRNTSQLRRDTKEIAESVQTLVKQFPRDAEEGYNAMEGMQKEYRRINPADKDDKDRFTILQESILQLQKKFGIVLPDPNLVENEIQITSQQPIAAFGLYDVYSGIYLGKEVWCKKLSFGDPQGKAMMRFRRELDIWSRLWKKDQERRRVEGAPPRVLPLYGFYIPYEGAAYLVNAKPERGTLRELLRSGAQLDPIKMIKRIALVLLLVHTMEPPIFHGDLNCTSIVIDEDWNPLLQDFRLSKTAFDVSGPTAVTHTIEKHTPLGSIEPVRWMAPETFDPRVGSTCSDIWSFGMVMYEILTKRDPYHNLPMFTVIAKVANGGTPNRPETITNDKIWGLMKDCWMLKPTERPTIEHVITRLDKL